MKLNNETISIEISNHGAELKSIKKNNIEYLWQGNPKYWKRSSPILFPIVGRLLDDEYIYNNKFYKMTQHGFARDNEFEMIYSKYNSVKYVLSETEETLKQYPFKFRLEIEYKLHENQLLVYWTVTNTDKKDIYFQIGAHPAFNFLSGSIIDINDKTNKYELKGTPNIDCVIQNVFIESIIIDDSSFLNDAIIYDNIDLVTLRDDMKAIKIECNDFPFIGIWSKVENKKNAPFICIEPWHGITDFNDHDKNIVNKKGVKKLKPNNIFKTEYKIIVY